MCVNAGSELNVMKIIHVFRSPVGGLFRHVCDLAREQRVLGHDVGVICDKKTGDDAAERSLGSLEYDCNLGLNRIAINTLPGLGDWAALERVKSIAKAVEAIVIHGHGAKGGVYARLAARKLGVAGVYSPHGGSLHYDWLKPPGAAFLAAERVLRIASSGIIFVCEFEKDLFRRKIGLGSCNSAVIYNGLQPDELTARELSPHASDFLFVGEMRALKGVDVLLEALAIAQKTKPYTLTLVGDGRDLSRFQQRAIDLGLDSTAHFVGRKTITEALPLGRVLVVPSRYESLPYVVLEAVAAKVPVIASRVGGIGEILPAAQLVEIGSSKALAKAMMNVAEPVGNREALHDKAAHIFTVRRMTEQTLAFYGSLH